MWRYVLHFLIRTAEVTVSSSNLGPNGATNRPGSGSLSYAIRRQGDRIGAPMLLLACHIHSDWPPISAFGAEADPLRKSHLCLAGRVENMNLHASLETEPYGSHRFEVGFGLATHNSTTAFADQSSIVLDRFPPNTRLAQALRISHDRKELGSFPCCGVRRALYGMR